MQTTGIDIVANKRIRGLLRKNRKSFLSKFLTASEIKRLKPHDELHICGLFAAKETIIKAFGSAGLKISFADIFISSGIPTAKVSKYPNAKINLSVAHEKDYSVAVAILQTLHQC